jgi:putative aminopeptidase FrvX
VNNAEDVRALGIRNGDYISVDPRFTVSDNGYIKSRNLDDKAAMACSFATLKYMADNNLKPKYNTVFAFSFYEETGLGGAYVPSEISEYIAVDIAILGPDSDGNEHSVTVCAKDTAMERQFYGDNESAYVVTLTETGAGKSGQFLFSTDKTTTDSLYEALRCTCE